MIGNKRKLSEDQERKGGGGHLAFLYRLNRLIPSLLLQLPLLQSFSQIFHAFVDFEAEPGENCKWNYN